MGRTTFLITMEEERVRELFSELKLACGIFYGEFHRQDAVAENMEIRGRLDFFDSPTGQILEEDLMGTLIDNFNYVCWGDVDAMSLSYKDSLSPHEPVKNAAVQIGIYGQPEEIGRRLFCTIRDAVFRRYSPRSLDMAYETFPLMMKGTSGGRIKFVEPKPDPREYFSFGKHPGLKDYDARKN